MRIWKRYETRFRGTPPDDPAQSHGDYRSGRDFPGCISRRMGSPAHSTSRTTNLECTESQSAGPNPAGGPTRPDADLEPDAGCAFGYGIFRNSSAIHNGRVGDP